MVKFLVAAAVVLVAFVAAGFIGLTTHHVFSIGSFGVSWGHLSALGLGYLTYRRVK